AATHSPPIKNEHGRASRARPFHRRCVQLQPVSHTSRDTSSCSGVDAGVTSGSPSFEWSVPFSRETMDRSLGRHAVQLMLLYVFSFFAAGVAAYGALTLVFALACLVLGHNSLEMI